MSFLDLSNVEESKGGYTPPVDGEYHIQVEDCEVSVKGDDKKQLMVKTKILAGDYQNTMVTDWFWFEHPNAKAKEIGLQKIKNLCVATGKSDKLESPKDLVGGICMAKVKNGTYNDKPQTKLSYFKKVDDTQSASESVFS